MSSKGIKPLDLQNVDNQDDGMLIPSPYGLLKDKFCNSLFEMGFPERKVSFLSFFHVITIIG
jgi:hypothetical protein